MKPLLWKNYRLFLFLIIMLFFAVSNVAAYQQPVIKQPAVTKDTTAKVKLIKRIESILQFRKRSRKREQQRIITIASGIFADSIVVTNENIQFLNEQLSKIEHPNFDSLRKLIHVMLADSIANVRKEKSASSEITPEQMNELAEKIVPLLQQKEKEENDHQAQQERLALIRSLYSRPPNQVDTLRLSDTTGARYRIRLAHQAEVIGMYNYNMGDVYMNFNFTTLSTLNVCNYLAAAPLKVFGMAREDGCNTMLTVQENVLLQSEAQQLIYIDSLLPLLEVHGSQGINIWLGNLPKGNRAAFTRFVTMLYNYLAHTSSGKYQLTVTIPAYDKEQSYDLRALEPLIKYFIIDFTKYAAGGGASDPLKGNNNLSIEPVVSRYINQHIAPGKFIILFPYRGIKWTANAQGEFSVFHSYVNYKDIRKEFPADTMIGYEETAVSAIAEGKDFQIWFDDPTTLDVKYDYVLRNGLGGVAVWPLGADDGYGELWDELTDKFIVADTVWLDTVRLTPEPVAAISLWQRIKWRIAYEIKCIHKLFIDPCSIKAESYKSDEYFRVLTIILFICSLITGFIYAFQLRREGSAWKWRKKVLYLLIGLIVLTLLSGTINLMLAKQLPILGFTDNPVECHTISVYSVLLAFVVGIILGMLLMRVFVFPLSRKQDVP